VSEHLSRHTVIFVVRLWAEYLEQTPPAWRGEVEHVQNGEKIAFRDLATLVAFIERWARTEKQTPTPQSNNDQTSCKQED